MVTIIVLNRQAVLTKNGYYSSDMIAMDKSSLNMHKFVKRPLVDGSFHEMEDISCFLDCITIVQSRC